MAPPSVRCLVELRSNESDFMRQPVNAAFLVSDEALSCASDPFAESSVQTVHAESSFQTANASTRDCTPDPRNSRPVPFLRFTMDHRPKDPRLGWVFGSSQHCCDVMLDQGSQNGVSAKQFAIKLQSEPGVLIVSNLSRNGTPMRLNTANFDRVKSQRAFGHRMDMSIGKLRVELLCPDHSLHRRLFERQWSMFYAEMEAEVPPLDSLALSAGPSLTKTRISLEYYLDGSIGRGEGGCVYRAVDRITGQVYAVKQYWSIEKVGKEVALLLQIQHPHIVKFHAFRATADCPELVLEYVHGQTLRQEHDQTRLNMLELKAMSRQTLDALSYLHAKGITHRDLKLDNIIVQTRQPMHIKLIDFNVSSDLAQMKTYVGTRRYLAPEILEHARLYDSKADIWSLGIMAMELFCGLPPFQDDWYQGDLELHLYFKGKPLMGAVHFIHFLLAKDPTQRPTADEALCHQFLEERQGDADVHLPLVDANMKHLSDTDQFDQSSVATIRAEHLPDTARWDQSSSSNKRARAPDCASPSQHAARESQVLTVSDLLHSDIWGPLSSIDKTAADALDDENPATGRRPAKRRESLAGHLDECTGSAHRGNAGDAALLGCEAQARDDEPESDQADVAPAEHNVKEFAFVRESWFLEGYMALSSGSDRLFFTTRDCEINATQLFKLNGVAAKLMTSFLFHRRDLEKRVLKRSRPEGGTYVKLAVARTLCDSFGLSWNPVDRISLYQTSRQDSSSAAGGNERLDQPEYVDGVGLREGYMAMSYRGCLVFFTVRDREVNVTQLFNVESRPLLPMRRHLAHHNVEKRVVNGGAESGTYVTPEAARELCTKFGLSCVPIDKVEAYEPRQVG
ncbi:Serine/threonine-protein kinase domain protein [Ophiocordyceps sinensis CO18]|uniref:Serine/threonine-protein kinase domain protein n=1 Tax=Ophiocordyceps sinensis (strain Co18 / CGMCC 3.14243) TaxID=911162 RepID=T5ADU9_OPHSC|nr:Serine/threonine-protein kinase domain protein [Ophiocordyceps sinensis CO18]